MTRRWLVVPIALAAGVAFAATSAGASGYVRPGTTVRASVASDGTQGLDPEGKLGATTQSEQFRSTLDARGRKVAFTSTAINLVPLDTNEVSDVFVHDLGTGATERASVSSQGLEGLGACLTDCVTLPTSGAGVKPFIGSYGATIDATGRYVAFVSYATNLVPGDTNLTGDVFVRDLVKHTTTRVSVSSSGAQANGTSGWLSTHPDAPIAISPGGRFVTFSSKASNLVPGDTNGVADVFVRDTKTHRTIRVSVGDGGVQSTRDCNFGSVVAHGRVAFIGGTNLTATPGVTVGGQGAFVRDLRSNKTIRVDVSPSGLAGDITVDSETAPLGLSSNGRYVTFMSDSDNLVPSDQNWGYDIFVRDLAVSRTARVSVTSWGGEAEADPPLDHSLIGSPGAQSTDAATSPDGRYVTFVGYSNSMAGSADGNSTPPFYGWDPDVFLYDRTTGALTWISKADDGGQADDADLPKSSPAYGSANSYSPALSADGRFVSFASNGDNLVRGDTNATPDFFVRDAGPALGSGSAIGLAGAGSSTALGALAVRDASNDVGAAQSAAGANLIGASIAYRAPTQDLFVRLPVRHMLPVELADPALVYGLDMTVRGARYEVRANAVAGVARFGLFRRDPSSTGLWTQVTDLRGGYGTTGEEVVFSIPLRDIGLVAGGRLSHVRAFTALGSFDTGPAQILDRTSLR